MLHGSTATMLRNSLSGNYYTAVLYTRATSLPACSSACLASVLLGRECAKQTHPHVYAYSRRCFFICTIDSPPLPTMLDYFYAQMSLEGGCEAGRAQVHPWLSFPAFRNLSACHRRRTPASGSGSASPGCFKLRSPLAWRLGYSL